MKTEITLRRPMAPSLIASQKCGTGEIAVHYSRGPLPTCWW